MKNASFRSSLFSKEAVQKFRRDRFTGMLLVNWENGVIDDMVLETEPDFKVPIPSSEDF